ncbi:MAG: D-Ala-D-Ala carboxypeptidase family metallohydrolase [Acinetobacter populi]|jgi:hypothetical protein|uniref:D-Ala-D-Ala carboxypeptidase family metallohydrolase n=1 Tax=Acinetobacter populi TaxID=1582270 RepID=UPI00235720E2|nr:D-Ala-D-Ala carboxypeptidase family metallohydrolase [Acinetobacter populi]MCH4247487.1 D-Ala-D-Ala carboxypeptidase family metallohydrolase [Acinetobacter populi]
MELFPYLSVLILLSACSNSVTRQNQIVNFSRTKVIQQKISDTPEKIIPALVIHPIPDDYQTWLNQLDHKQQVNDYKNFLKKYDLNEIVPDHDLLRSARDWQKCYAPAFEVPPQEVWLNIIPTLQILKRLVDDKILDDFTVTSVYRNFNLNRCAGGADSSRHVFNAALDFRIGPENPQPEDFIRIDQSKIKLCKFWEEYGQALNMGLGVYASGKIHIDSLGFRTWGPDHHSASSPCITSLVSN